MCSLEFIAEQFQQFADYDPEHWNSEEGCIIFDQTPVFYQRFDDFFLLEVEGLVMELPRM